MLCKECGNNPIENRDTGLCASCGAAARKMARIGARVAKRLTAPPIPKLSQKMATDLRTYNQKRIEHLKRYPHCQIRLLGCTHIGTSVHHSAKRGKNLNNEETFMTACHHCHVKIETVMSAAERRGRGFLK